MLKSISQWKHQQLCNLLKPDTIADIFQRTLAYIEHHRFGTYKIFLKKKIPDRNKYVFVSGAKLYYSCEQLILKLSHYVNLINTLSVRTLIIWHQTPRLEVRCLHSMERREDVKQNSLIGYF